MNISEVLIRIKENAFDPLFAQLYGDSQKTLEHQKDRYTKALESFMALYPRHEEVKLFSAPGRTEIGGNHTDHQHGCVLAAAVNLDVIAVVSFHNEGVIRVASEGYEPFEVSLDDLSVQQGEISSTAMVRGIANRFSEMGVAIGGFDAYTTSDVIGGSGISSSAAFETLIGTIIDEHYNGGKAGAVEIAKIGQYAENVYFGKNSGLMDQMVSSMGGLVSIDFFNTQNPAIKSFQYDFEQAGYCIFITDTKGSHANLTDDYVAIRDEMERVAVFFGKQYLREVEEREFYAALPEIRKACSDRAILRAAHFFDENRRAFMEALTLEKGNVEEFLTLVRQSGESSANLLQNLYSCSKATNQEIPLAIMMSKRILNGRGAVRVHGGGFAGTIQAFVPLDLADEYIKEMDRIYGEKSCMKMRIRPFGGIEITKECE